jgi:hypothetical protein
MDNFNVGAACIALVIVSFIASISGYSAYEEYLYNDYRKVAIEKGENEIDRRCAKVNTNTDNSAQTAICLKYLDVKKGTK